MDEQRAGQRGADGATDLAEEVVRRGGSTDFSDWEGVLDNENQHLHHKAQADTENEQVTAQNGERGVLGHRGQQQETHRGDGQADEREHLVTADPRDDETNAGGGADEADHHRNHHQARLGRGHGVDHLQVGRHVSEHTEHGDAHEGTGDGGQHHVARLEQAHRDQRVLRAVFHDDEDDRANEGGNAQAPHVRVRPLVFGAAPGGHEDERGCGNEKENSAQPVVAGDTALALAQAQNKGAHEQGEQAQWDVEPEPPAPTRAIGDPATQDRAEYGAQAEYGAHDSHVFTAVTGGDDLRHDGLRGNHEAAGADALDGAADDQKLHGVGKTAQGGAD